MSSLGSLTDRVASQSFAAIHSSSRSLLAFGFMAELSDTFTSRTLYPCSRRRSATPEPRPIVSTHISIGRSILASLTTMPTVCIRSKPPHDLISSTTEPRRLQRAVLSVPKRATSSPYTTGSSPLTVKSLLIAPSTNSAGIRVSSSARANSPKTRIRKALLDSP